LQASPHDDRETAGGYQPTVTAQTRIPGPKESGARRSIPAPSLKNAAIKKEKIAPSQPDRREKTVAFQLGKELSDERTRRLKAEEDARKVW
jgi:hypothetical protein